MFPAIFGTVVMTLLMSLAVVPLGVLAALSSASMPRRGRRQRRAVAVQQSGRA